MNVYGRQEFEGKKVTQICYFVIFLMFYVRGESEVRRGTEERKNKAKNMEKKEEEEEEVARSRRVRIRADLHEVSSFYRHSWKIP